MLSCFKRLGLGAAFFIAFLTTPSLHGQVTLRVALFPYLPDVAGDSLRTLRESIVQRFNAAHNNTIKLELRMDPRDDFYSVDTLQKWLTAPGSNRYDVVEIDAVLLDTLIKTNLIRPWQNVRSDNWFPGLENALTHMGWLYGIPHWLCSDFIITREPSVYRAATFDSLMAALEHSRPITAAVGGSWTLPALYLHAWVDSHGTAQMETAISTKLDSTAVQNLRRLVGKCLIYDRNPCLTGDDDWAGAIFASGTANTLIGYSERLTSVIQRGTDPNTLLLSALPLGNRNGQRLGDVPLLYVDALVLRNGCNLECQGAARTFATWLLNDTTYQFILQAQDAPAQPAVPRYLIPATSTAFDMPGVMGDRLFEHIRAAIRGGVPIPTGGLPGARRDMQRELLRLFGAPPQ